MMRVWLIYFIGLCVGAAIIALPKLPLGVPFLIGASTTYLAYKIDEWLLPEGRQ